MSRLNVAVYANVQFAKNMLISDEEISSDDADDSSSDEEVVLLMIRTKRKRSQCVRIRNYCNQVVPAYSAREFQHHFRVTREAFESLLRFVGPLLKRRLVIGRQPIDVEKQLLSVIWLLATPDSYRSIGERFDMGKSSLSVTFVRFVKILNKLAKRIIKWPTHGQAVQIERAFFQMAHVTGVIGAVDGTFIPIKAPREDAETYVTRKCNHAITLQAICGPSLKYTDIFVGYPGSVSDSRIFKNSDVYNKACQNAEDLFPQNTFIIGDKAYPTLPWCIPPYIDRGNLTARQRHFNTMISKTRQTIERSFALLFGRFRRLKYLDMSRTDLIPATVLAACTLHNICLDHDDLLIENYIGEGRPFAQHNDEVENIRNNLEAVQAGRHRRDYLCNMLYNDQNRE